MWRSSGPLIKFLTQTRMLGEGSKSPLRKASFKNKGISAVQLYSASNFARWSANYGSHGQFGSVDLSPIFYPVKFYHILYSWFSYVRFSSSFPLAKFHSISYMYFSLFGLVVTYVVGWLVTVCCSKYRWSLVDPNALG